MARADPRHAAWQNLAAFLDELRQNVGSLVVDEVHLLDTELADLLLSEILALAAARTSRSAGTAGCTFATASTGAAFPTTSDGMSRLATFAVSGRRWARCLLLFL
jgi:hypothetical protein